VNGNPFFDTGSFGQKKIPLAGAKGIASKDI